MDDSISASSGSYVSSETSVASTDDTQDLSESATAVSHLGGIEETIDRLYRFTWLIRTPSAASQNAKAITFRMKDDYGCNYEEAFQKYAEEVVKHRCPDAGPELVRKISEAITLRRKRFLYRRHHQDKLSFGPLETPDTVDRGASFRTSPLSTDHGGGSIGQSGRTSERLTTGLRRVTLSATSASALSKLHFRQDAVFQAQSVASTTLYAPDDTADSFQPPPPPTVPAGSKEFECPYCYIMMPIKEARPAHWK